MIGYTPTPDYYNDYICHYGVKGMKWRNHVYKAKSKMRGLLIKARRRKFYGKDPANVTTNNGRLLIGYDNGKPDSYSGRTGSRLKSGIAAGRKRVKKKRR